MTTRHLAHALKSKCKYFTNLHQQGLFATRKKEGMGDSFWSYWWRCWRGLWALRKKRLLMLRANCSRVDLGCASVVFWTAVNASISCPSNVFGLRYYVCVGVTAFHPLRRSSDSLAWMRDEGLIFGFMLIGAEKQLRVDHEPKIGSHWREKKDIRKAWLLEELRLGAGKHSYFAGRIAIKGRCQPS